MIPELLEELTGRWRAFTTAEDTRRAEFLLGDAWRKIARVPTLLERMGADDNLAADVRMVVCDATKRAMIAEGRLGVEEEERTDGPISRRRRYAAATSASIEFTEDEKTLLEGPAADADAVQPRWTGDVVPVVVTMPHWPRDAVAITSRRPW